MRETRIELCSRLNICINNTRKYCMCLSIWASHFYSRLLMMSWTYARKSLLVLFIPVLLLISTSPFHVNYSMMLKWPIVSCFFPHYFSLSRVQIENLKWHFLLMLILFERVYMCACAYCICINMMYCIGCFTLFYEHILKFTFIQINRVDCRHCNKIICSSFTE